MFLGLRLHYSLLAFLYKFDAYAPAFLSLGGTASSRTRSPSLPFHSLCYVLEDHGISRNTIVLTLDIGLALHTNQRSGLFIRPIARYHWCMLLQTLITHIVHVHARDCTETHHEVDSIHFKPHREVVWVEPV